MEVLLSLLYVALCLTVAILGRHTRIGYWGTFLVSMVATPFLVFAFLFLLTPRAPAPRY
jgi:hypothetical protein